MLPTDDTDDAPDSSAADGRQLRWEEHNRARRRQLLDAAIQLLDEGDVGAEVRMAEIAERAGVRRPVIYRHFTDRQALDAAIEAEIAERLAAEVLPHLDVHRPIIEIIHDSIAVYIRWSDAHPSLRWVLDRGARSPGSPVERGFSDIARIISAIVLAAIDGLDLPVNAHERRYIDPLIHGLVEAVVGTVRRWIALEDRPPANLLVHLATESVWYIMAGHAQALGVTLERDQNIADLQSSGRD